MAGDAASPVLHLEALHFRWPGAREDCLAIDRFSLAPGEKVFLRGASGAGKSTLLSLAAGVLAPTQGAVRLLGHALQTLPPAGRDRLRGDHIGYLFQQFNLLPYLDAVDNVMLACRLSARRQERAGGPQAALATARQLLEEFGLPPDSLRRRASALSVGQQQRVAAARALIGQPELVIADEPTSALDESARDAFMALLMRSCRASGSALLFVSHDGRLARHFDRQVELEQIGRQVDLEQLNRAAATNRAALPEPA